MTNNPDTIVLFNQLTTAYEQDPHVTIVKLLIYDELRDIFVEPLQNDEIDAVYEMYRDDQIFPNICSFIDYIEEECYTTGLTLREFLQSEGYIEED